MAYKVLIGLAAGFTFGILGFGKSSKRQKFEYKKFLPTVIIGFILGLISEFIAVQMDLLEWYFLDLGLVTIIEYGFKTFKRRLWSKLL
jgi:hypothetical protein